MSSETIVFAPGEGLRSLTSAGSPQHSRYDQ